MVYVSLKNKKFFLHLKNRGDEEKLRNHIKGLGGTVVDFLQNDVTACISDDPLVPVLKHHRESLSPVQNGKKLRVSLSGPAPLPDRNDRKVRKRLTERIYGRLPAVLKEVNNLGIEVLSFERFSQRIERLQNVQRSVADDVLRRRIVKHSPNWLRDLKQPLIKIEDRSDAFRPQYHEFQQWPVLVIEPGNSEASPFRKLRPAKANMSSVFSGAARKLLSTAAPTTADNVHRCSTRRPQQTNNANHRSIEDKNGYCEICKTSFRSFKLHCSSGSHKKFKNDSKLYKMIDTEIGKCCPFDRFLVKLDDQDHTVSPRKRMKRPVKAHSTPPSPQHNPGSQFFSEPQFSASDDMKADVSRFGCPTFMEFLFDVKENEAGSANLVAIENRMNFPPPSPVFWPKRRSQAV